MLFSEYYFVRIYFSMDIFDSFLKQFIFWNRAHFFKNQTTLRLITNCNYVFPLIHKRKNSITKLMLMYFTFWCRILNFWCLFFLKMSSQTLSMANWDNLSCQKITFKTLTLSTGKERKFHSYLICNWRRSLKDVNCTPFVVKKVGISKGKKGIHGTSSVESN